MRIGRSPYTLLAQYFRFKRDKSAHGVMACELEAVLDFGFDNVADFRKYAELHGDPVTNLHDVDG